MKVYFEIVRQVLTVLRVAQRIFDWYHAAAPQISSIARVPTMANKAAVALRAITAVEESYRTLI